MPDPVPVPDPVPHSAHPNKDTIFKLVKYHIEKPLIRSPLAPHSTKPSVIPEDKNVFDYGANSTTAVTIWRGICNELNKYPLPRRKDGQETYPIDKVIPQNVLYSKPSMLQLADAILGLYHTGGWALPTIEEQLADLERRAIELVNLRQFPTPSADLSSVSQLAPPVILITGSTGALGSAILYQLLTDRSLQPVTRIYALTTKKETEEDVKAEIKYQLHIRGFDLASEELGRVEVVKWLCENQPDSRLGIAEDKYSEIRREVTHIVHCAWLVDYNRMLPDFETLLKATRELADFALSSPRATPPRLLFTSTVGVHRIEEEFVEPAQAPVGTGYGESKWVAETVLRSAGKGWKGEEDERGWRPIIVRVGQLCGSTSNGNWKQQEWFPRLVDSGTGLRQFPEVDGYVDWLPTDVAAKAICEILYTPETPRTPLHLVHPHPVEWKNVISWVAENRGGKLVCFGKWINEVNKKPRHNVSNPAALLLDWFRKATLAIPEKLETEEAVRFAPSLGGITPLNQDNVNAWLVWWWDGEGFVGEGFD
ncbi:hypothetical protein BOTBODRAFT_59168 [Botryobasidium botryosum FD-172 SS1]|uniref:Thioester reductase (TE) domain-containing protein n=1 Tax=Botryobasidium botryosum (strain FD-172 SS1) TaxID=930990 RepID=A0A067MA03_BOTB1|nr:hypothetical protein BOTBODRAFT_59168 [Botryobasidium botryosum FD-172 SS1]